MACLAIGFLLIRNSTASQRRFSKQLFEEKVKTFILTLDERYARNGVMLEGLEGFFNASENVTQQEWDQNIENLNLRQDFPAIAWIAAIESLQRDQVSAFINKQRANSGSNYKIWPPSDNPRVFPVVYVSPPEFSPLTGNDLGSNPAIREALINSLNTKEPTTSPAFSVDAVQEVKSERVLFWPIIAPGENQVKGWTAAAIDFATIIDQTAEKSGLADFQIYVYLGDREDVDNLIYEQKTELNFKSNISINQVIEFAGADWTFAFKGPVLKGSITTANIFYLVFILILMTFLAALFLYFYYLRKDPNIRLDSSIEQHILNSTQYAFIATDTKGVITYFNPAAEKLLGYSASEMVGKLTPESFHDPEEMQLRATELSTILKKEVKPGFDVFVAFAEKNVPENRKWTYIKKDKSRVNVQLSVTAIKNEIQQTTGYLGVIIESALLNV